MSTVSPSQSNAGDLITAAAINNPVNQIAAVINGGIDSSNLADNGITSAKVASGLSSGKLANPYKFSAWAGGGQVVDNTFSVVLQFNNKSFDTSSNYSTSTFRFTAPVAGFYYFSALVTMVTPANNILLGLFVNTETTARLRGPSVTANSTNVAGMIQLAANDYVVIKQYSSNTANVNTTTDISQTFFNGFLVSTT